MFNRSVIFKAKYNKLGSSGLGSILDFTYRDAMGGLLSIKNNNIAFNSVNCSGVDTRGLKIITLKQIPPDQISLICQKPKKNFPV